MVKRPLMLLEILIGLALMSILLAFLFTSLTRSARFETKIEKARATLLERQHLQTRLHDVFLTTRDASLYTKKLPEDQEESLIAVFDHGIDPVPAFSGPVLARIYLDDSNLSLAVWPIEKQEKKHPWRKEILLSHVEELEWRFLGKKTEPGIEPVDAQLAWYDRWPEKRDENPSMVRLMIRQKGGDALYYAFFFSNPEPIATYWEN